MYRLTKRLCDIVIALIGIVACIPLFFIVGLLINLTSPGPVFFVQKRSGKNRKPFYIIKFRSMRVGTPSNVPTSEFVGAEHYIMPVGRFLRKTSLDEIPQLFNILLGQMSFIGPRPVLEREVELINARERYDANSVRPGLTGLAQINGRDFLDTESKAELDGQYVKNMSLSLDVDIFLRTIEYVVKRRDISA